MIEPRSVPELLKAPIPDASEGKKPIRLHEKRSYRGCEWYSSPIARSPICRTGRMESTITLSRAGVIISN